MDVDDENTDPIIKGVDEDVPMEDAADDEINDDEVGNSDRFSALEARDTPKWNRVSCVEEMMRVFQSCSSKCFCDFIL